MDGQIDLITLISLIVAVVVILKLRSVLGRRTGMSRRGSSDTAPSSSVDKHAGRLRRRQGRHPAAARAREAAPGPAPGTSVAEAEARIKTFAGADDRVAAGSSTS